MTVRKHTPLHDKWHPRVEGQIRDCLTSHPEWFSFNGAQDRQSCINSLAKRIVGEIVADYEATAGKPTYISLTNSWAGARLTPGPGAMAANCGAQDKGGDGTKPVPAGAASGSSAAGRSFFSRYWQNLKEIYAPMFER